MWLINKKGDLKGGGGGGGGCFVSIKREGLVLHVRIIKTLMVCLVCRVRLEMLKGQLPTIHPHFFIYYIPPKPYYFIA